MQKTKTNSSKPRCQNKNEETLLITAAKDGDTKMVELILISIDIDINAQDKYGKTALIDATVWRKTKSVRLLLKCKNIDINIIANRGSYICFERTAFQAALRDDFNIRTIKIIFLFILKYSYIKIGKILKK
jgi:hypothetical protein